MKTRLLALMAFATFVVSACADPKSHKIPSGPASEWPASFTESTETLSAEERELLAGYLVRRSLSGDPGTELTISEAIDNQRAFEAERISRETEEAALAEQARKAKEDRIAAFREKVTVALAGTTLLPENYSAGRYSPEFRMELAVANKSNKDIRGVKGTVVFRDLFDDEFLRIGLSMDERVAAGEQRTIGGYGLELNQFMDDHNKLAATKYEDLKFEFVPEAIVFADGTTERISEE